VPVAASCYSAVGEAVQQVNEHVEIAVDVSGKEFVWAVVSLFGGIKVSTVLSNALAEPGLVCRAGNSSVRRIEKRPV
jgi:hypothetical protein